MGRIHYIISPVYALLLVCCTSICCPVPNVSTAARTNLVDATYLEWSPIHSCLVVHRRVIATGLHWLVHPISQQIMRFSVSDQISAPIWCVGEPVLVICVVVMNGIRCTSGKKSKYCCLVHEHCIATHSCRDYQRLPGIEVACPMTSEHPNTPQRILYILEMV